jgi:hypothetical protein
LMRRGPLARAPVFRYWPVSIPTNLAAGL